ADPRAQGDQPIGPAGVSETDPEGPSLALLDDDADEGGDEDAEGQAEQRCRPELARRAERREAETVEDNSSQQPADGVAGAETLHGVAPCWLLCPLPILRPS